MSLAALRSDAAHWEELRLLGRAVEPRKSSDRSGILCYDVEDTRCEKGWLVQDTVVLGPYPSPARPTWRCCSFPLPQGCAAPVWVPADFKLEKEPTPASVVFDDAVRCTLNQAPDQLAASCTMLQPDTELSVCWEEPLVRVGIQTDPTQASLQRHVGAIVFGPSMVMRLRRSAAGHLVLVELSGGPDGAATIASEFVGTLLRELEASKQQGLKNERPTKVVAFGRVVTLKTTDTGPSWDGDMEAFALWSAMKQWQRSVRRQPWQWKMQRIELHGSKKQGESPRKTRTINFLTSATPKGKTMKMTLSGDSSLALLKIFDKDSNGFVGWPEFNTTAAMLASMLGTEETWTEDVALQEFQKLDVNGNGVVEEDEWLNYLDGFLEALGCKDLSRILTMMGEDSNFSGARLVSAIPGDVDVGLSCKRGHSIRPLPLRSWGEQLAKTMILTGGFRCAEVDDPTVFAAAQRQRCTRCRSMESTATFSVACQQCMSSSDTGWWCTRCVLQSCSARDRFGHRIAWGRRLRQGPCRYCPEPATIAWPATEGVDLLCNNHAAANLLEEAAWGGAASGRQPTEGPCLVVSLELWLDIDFDADEGEELAGALESELLAALSLEGNVLSKAQLEISRVFPNPEDSDVTGVQLELLCFPGKPSPYELFLRLQCLIVDEDGPIYSASQYEHLRTLRQHPKVLNIVVANPQEDLEMSARLSQARGERWPHGVCADPMLVVVRPREELLPSSAVVSLRCVRPPETVGGTCWAHCLAFPAGSKKKHPDFAEFKAFFKGSKAAEDDDESHAGSKSKPSGRPPPAAKPKAKTKAKGKTAEAGCVVPLSTCHSGDINILEGKATLFNLKSTTNYDVYVAIFPGAELDPSHPKPLAFAVGEVATSSASQVKSFGLERDGGVVAILTEEPDFHRQACMLDLLGLSSAPCIIDRNTCALSWKVNDKEKSAEKVVKDNSIKVELKAPKGGLENPALSGGVQLPVPTLSAKPAHIEAKTEISVTASACVLSRPCPRHLAAAWRPVVLGIHGRPTEAQGSTHSAEDCADCKWTTVKHTHSLKVDIILDIVRMAEIRDLRSVIKRSDICPREEVRAALGVLLTTRPMLQRDVILEVFEKCAGRTNEVDFAVRTDGATCLHVAVEESQLESVRYLLRRNMDPSIPNKLLETPLHAAARGANSNAQQIAALLLENVKVVWHGDEFTEKDKEAARLKLINKKDVLGRTLLHMAALGDQQALFRFALQNRADVGAQDNAGWSVLHAAAAAGAYSCVSLLMSAGAEVNVLSAGDRGVTALHCSCEQGRWEVAQQLLDRKADPKIAPPPPPPKGSARAPPSKGSSTPATPASQQIAVPEKSPVDHPITLLARSLAKMGPHASDCSGAVAVASKLLKFGKPSKIALEAAAAALCDLALWTASDTEAFDATSELLGMMSESGLNKEHALGPALISAVEGALDGGLAGDRRNDNRVAQAQAAGICLMDTPEIVDLALQLGANASACNASKDTAMHLLLRFPLRTRALPNDEGSGTAVAKAMALLLEKKASLTVKNTHGETPLSIAAQLHDMGEHYGKLWEALLPGHGHKALHPPGSSPRPVSSQERKNSRAKAPIPLASSSAGAVQIARTLLPDVPTKPGDAPIIPALPDIGKHSRTGGDLVGSARSNRSARDTPGSNGVRLPAIGR